MNTLESLIYETREDQVQLPPGHTPYSPTHPRKHGYVPEILLTNAERDSFYALEERLYDEYRPTCATESLLLDEVTLNYWRLQRARILEADALTEDRDNQKLIALYHRYRTGFERSFYRALRFLRKVKAESAKLIAQYATQLAGCSVCRTAARFVSQNESSRIKAGVQTGDLPDFDEAA